MDAHGLALLKAMLNFDPSKRTLVDDALHHPFLADEQSDEKEFDACCPSPMSAEIESLSEENLEHLTDAVRLQTTNFIDDVFPNLCSCLFVSPLIDCSRSTLLQAAPCDPLTLLMNSFCNIMSFAYI